MGLWAAVYLSVYLFFHADSCVFASYHCVSISMRLYTVKVVGLPMSLWTAFLQAEGNLSLPFIPGYEKMCVAVCSGKEYLSLKQSRSSPREWHYDHFLGCFGIAFPRGPAFRPLGAEAPGAWRAFPAVPASPFQPAHWLCLR